MGCVIIYYIHVSVPLLRVKVISFGSCVPVGCVIHITEVSLSLQRMKSLLALDLVYVGVDVFLLDLVYVGAVVSLLERCPH